MLNNPKYRKGIALLNNPLTRRKIELPGLTFNIMKGPGILSGDNVFSEQLHVSQQERVLLENLQLSMKVDATSKV
jgi:hypothetical protein